MKAEIQHSCLDDVSLASLAITFLKVSLYGIGGGGGLVWARRLVVEQQRWISEQDFADIVSLSQFMPGPNIVGIAICVRKNCAAQSEQWPLSRVFF